MGKFSEIDLDQLDALVEADDDIFTGSLSEAEVNHMQRVMLMSDLEFLAAELDAIYHRLKYYDEPVTEEQLMRFIRDLKKTLKEQQ